MTRKRDDLKAAVRSVTRVISGLVAGCWLLVAGCWLLVRATIHYGTRHHRGHGRSNLRVLLDLLRARRGLRGSDVGDRSRCDCQENHFRNEEHQIEEPNMWYSRLWKPTKKMTPASLEKTAVHAVAR